MATRETLNTRVVRLENAVQHIAELQAQHEIEHHRWQKEAQEREARLDERIGNLVSAIGELISEMRRR